MKNPFFQKLDILIIVLLLAATVVGFYLISSGTSMSASVKISKNGELIGFYPLNQDDYIIIDSHNSVRIEGGKVWMAHADCPDGYCLKMGEIDSGSIICLPNRVVVEIISDVAPDAIAGMLR